MSKNAATLAAALGNTEQNDLDISNEGWKGGLAGFLAGAAAVTFKPGFGNLVTGAVSAAVKADLNKKRQEIQIIAKRIADIRNGDLEKAKKEGIKIRESSLKPLSAGQVVLGYLGGSFFTGLYLGYRSHQLEDAYKELQEKITDLKFELDANNITLESFEGVEALATDEPVVTTDVDAEVPAESEGEVAVVADEDVVVDNADSFEEGLNETADAEDAVDEEIDQAEELEAAATGLEAVHDMLLELRAAGPVDSQTLKFANVAIESYGKRLGLGQELQISTESFEGELSLESVKETLKKAWDAAVKFLIKVKDAIFNFLKRIFTAAGRLQKRGERLGKLKLTGAPKAGEIEFKGLAKRLAIGTKVETDPVKGLNGLIQTIEACVKWDAEVVKAADTLRQKVVDASKGEGSGVVDLRDIGAPTGFTKIEAGGKWGWKTATLPGNVHFTGTFDTDESGVIKANDRAMLFGGRFAKEQEKVDVSESMKIRTLSISEIAKSAQAITHLVQVVKKAQDAASASVKRAKSLGNVLEVQGNFEERSKAVGYIMLFRKMDALPGQLTGKVVAHALSVAGGYLQLAEKSAVQYTAAKGAPAPQLLLKAS